MSATPKPADKTDAARDLPLKEGHSKEVQGGKGCAAGEHIKEATMTVRK